ncbi:hypothetical protein D1872_318100 [compost metagenome]
MACQMDFHNRLGREGIQIHRRIEAQVMRADVDVIDIQQQPTASSRAQLGQKVEFAEFMTIQA